MIEDDSSERIRSLEQSTVFGEAHPGYEQWEEASITLHDGTLQIRSFAISNFPRFAAICLFAIGCLWSAVLAMQLPSVGHFNWRVFCQFLIMALLPCAICLNWALRREVFIIDGSTIKLSRSFQPDAVFDIRKGAFVHFGDIPMPGFLGREPRLWVIQGNECMAWGQGVTVKERERIWQQFQTMYPEVCREDIQAELAEGHLKKLTALYVIEQTGGLLIIRPKRMIRYDVWGWKLLSICSIVVCANLVMSTVVGFGSIIIPLLALLGLSLYGMRRRPLDRRIIIDSESMSYLQGTARKTVLLSHITDLQAVTLKHAHTNAPQSMVAFRTNSMPVVLIKDVTRIEAESIVEAIDTASNGSIRRTG